MKFPALGLRLVRPAVNLVHKAGGHGGSTPPSSMARFLPVSLDNLCTGHGSPCPCRAIKRQGGKQGGVMVALDERQAKDAGSTPAPAKPRQSRRLTTG